MVLGGFVGGFGWFWVVLGGFGSFWVVLGGFGWFRVLVTTNFKIRSYLEISHSIFEQMVQFTFLSNIHAICSLFHPFKGKIGVI